jgi:hypothetical protein
MAVCFTGCVSKQAYVIARLDPQYSPTSSSRIALVHQNQPRPEDQDLGRALVAELERQGFQIVPQEAADYTLACWIENDWRTRKTIVQTSEPGLGLRGETLTHMPPAAYSSPGGSFTHYHATPYQTTRVVDEQVPAQGIRLRLYPRANSRAASLQPAWDGYIDGGPKVSAERQPILLKTLLSYFGRDFTGPAPLLDDVTE